MSLPVLLLMMFLATSLGVAATWSVYSDLAFRDEERARLRVDGEFRKRQAAKPASRVFRKLGAGGLEDPAGAAEGGARPGALLLAGWCGRIDVLLAQAALPLAAWQLAVLTLCAGVVGALFGLVAVGPVSAGVGGGVGACMPLGFVLARRNARRDRFLRQLPGAFDLMARVMRSGHSVPQAFQAVADTFEDPIAGEFARCREQQNLGLLPEVAFRELAERCGVLEMKIFVMAMLIQRQTGGNLSEVLDRLAALIRERVRLRNHIHTLTAEGRLQAAVLLVLPFLMFLVMRFINRVYADVLFDHLPLLGGMVLAMGVGAVWIRRIITIDL